MNGDKITPEQLFEDPEHDQRGSLDATLTIVPPKGLELGSAICNRLLHPRAGVAPSRLVLGCNDEGALASHGIDRAMQQALRQGDTETFLRRRADVLEEWIAHFVDARAEWERPDTPSIRALAKGKRAP